MKESTIGLWNLAEYVHEIKKIDYRVRVNDTRRLLDSFHNWLILSSVTFVQNVMTLVYEQFAKFLCTYSVKLVNQPLNIVSFIVRYFRCRHMGNHTWSRIRKSCIFSSFYYFHLIYMCMKQSTSTSY